MGNRLVANDALRARIRHEIAKHAGWTRDVAVAVYRANNISPTILSDRRFEDQKVVHAEPAAWPQSIGPHRLAAAVYQRGAVVLGDLQTFRGPDWQTILGSAG